jgi:hypothetical protein
MRPKRAGLSFLFTAWNKEILLKVGKSGCRDISMVFDAI